MLLTDDHLTPAERSAYDWQLDVPGFGETGQLKLKRASVLISRVGGVGGAVAYQLAAAGVGHLILAHAGPIRPGDLNRQLLMTHAGIGRLRVESAAQRLAELNPHVRITPIAENVNEANVEQLVGPADLIVDCAPLFSERFALNRAAVCQGKPMVECAVYELQAQLTTLLPGRTPCLACLYPEDPPAWRRRFPVFGAVAGTAGSLAAMEVIKVLSGLGEPLAGRLLVLDLRTMAVQSVLLQRRAGCPVCGAPSQTSEVSKTSEV
jgi:molybdopterin/thiamine biosynthesis adenylyltransferase